VAAVLEREGHLAEAGSPGQQLQVPVGVGAQGALAQPPADVVDGDEGVGALVGVGADHHHGRGPSARYWMDVLVAGCGGHASIQPGAGSYQATPRPTARAPAGPHIGRATNDEVCRGSEETSEPDRTTSA
jgi:hypothetical protein